MANKKLATLAVALSAVIASHGQATTIDVTDNDWHTFDVSKDLSGGTDWIDIADASVLDVKITLANATLVTVVDGGFPVTVSRYSTTATSWGLPPLPQTAIRPAWA